MASDGGPTDELLRRLLAAMAAEASDVHVDRLIAEARAEAEADVKAVVKSAFKASLLRRATERLECDESPVAAETLSPRTPAAVGGDDSPDGPPPEALPSAAPPRAEGHGAPCYVYAIVDAGPQTWLSEASGVDPDGVIEAVRHGDVQALISVVSPDRFNQATIDEHLNDPAWLEAKVRAHDDVVRAAMRSSAVVPCRFGTVVRDRADVRRLLATHHDDLVNTLRTLAGKEEWGVKVRADLDAMSRHLAASDPGPVGEASGRSYLQRRQRRDQARGEAQRAARARADECHLELSSIASAASVLPVRASAAEATRGNAETLLSAAYLVASEHLGDFHDAVAHLAGRLRPLGLEFDLTGPWPPYNFASFDLSLQAVA
jgi:hypothetical protein